MHCYPYPYGIMSVQIDVDSNKKCPNLQIFFSLILVLWRGTTEVGCFFFSFSILLGPPTYFNPLASSRNKEVIPKFPPLNLGLAEGLATLS